MKKLIQKTLITLLVLQGLYWASPPSVYAEQMTCPEHTPVTIDIKPGGYPNKINLSANGLLPVAVLNTEAFDASQFTPQEAHLSDADVAMTETCGGAQAIRWAREDVDGDGDLDLVFFFKIRELNLTPESTAATLMAHGTFDSSILHIMGTDSVSVKP